MGDIRDQLPEDLKQAYQGLDHLLTGKDPHAGGLARAPSLLNVQLLADKVNSNMRPLVNPNQNGTQQGNVTADMLGDQKGTRDKLKDIATRVQTGQTVTPAEMTSLESILYYAGYQIGFDGTLSPDERVSLTDFDQRYLSNPNATLRDVQNANVGLSNASDSLRGDMDAAIAAAEQARTVLEAAAIVEQDQLSARYDAGLVYSGYLDAKNIGNDVARQQAMYDLMLDNQYQVIDGTTDLHGRMREYFPEGSDGVRVGATQAGYERMMELTAGIDAVPAQFQDHIESGDPRLVALAQNYMELKGHEIPDEEMGVVGRTTFDTAQSMIRADITVPESLYYLDGSGVNYGQVFALASHDRLPLPSDADLSKYLNEDEIAALDFYGDDLASRSEFIATTMLSTPGTDGAKSRYHNFVDDHNAANDEVVLQANIEHRLVSIDLDNGSMIIPASLGPAMASDERTALTENAALSNPVGVTAIDKEVIGGSSILAEVVHNDAYGVVDDGRLAFDQENRDLITGVYKESFIGFAQANGGDMTMYDAIRISHGITSTQQEQFLSGATGMSAAPSMQEGQRLQQSMGFDLDRTFDPTVQGDMQTLLQGTFAYENKESLIQVGGANYAETFMNQNGTSAEILEIQASISRVTGMPYKGTNDVRLADAPEISTPKVEEVAVETKAPISLPTPSADNMSYGSLWPTTGTTMFQATLPAAQSTTPAMDMTQSFGMSVNSGPLSLPEMSTPQIDIGFGAKTEQPKMSTGNPFIMDAFGG